MNAEAKHGGPVDVIAILRKASRSVPNEDFVAFDDAIFAVVALVEVVELELRQLDGSATRVSMGDRATRLRAALTNFGSAS